MSARLATVYDLLAHLRLDVRDLAVDAVEVWNSDESASRATVRVSNLAVSVTKETGSASVVHRYRFADYPTLAELCNAIQGYAGEAPSTTTYTSMEHGWLTRMLAHPDSSTFQIEFAETTDALGYPSRVTLRVYDVLWAQNLLDQAVNLMETVCRRSFLFATYTDEEHDGSGDNLLLLRNYPVDEVTSVEVDGEEVDADTYSLDAAAGILWRNSSAVWEGGHRNITVTYDAGYVTPPQELKQLCLEIAAQFYAKGGRDPLLRSIRLGQTTHSYWEGFLGPGLYERLCLWRRMEVYRL